MSAKRLFASGELDDGTTWADLPVTVATRVQAERTGKTNGWDLETHSMTMSAFMSWHVSRARGIHDLKWDEFTQRAVAADVDAADTNEDEDDPDLTPTRTAP